MLGLYLAQMVNSGLALGAVYGLMALGFSLIYNSSRLINFAQGELLLVSGLGLYSLSSLLNAPPLLCLAAAGLWGFLLGWALYATTLGVTLNANPLRQLMLTVAASLIWQGAAILIWGKKPLMPPQLFALSPLRLGPLFFSRDTLTGLILAVTSGGLLTLFLRYTRTGRAIRAVSMNPVAAMLQGVNPKRAYALSFALAGVLAALAGVAIGPQTMLRYDMGLGLGLKGFVAATLGGYSSLGRVFLGGIALGLIESGLVLVLNAELKETIAYALLIVLLIVVPHREKHHERA